MTNSRAFAVSAILIALRCSVQGKGGVYFVAGFAAASASSSAASPPAALPQSLLTRIRKAIELTTSKSAHNITAAREAVDLWGGILGESDGAVDRDTVDDVVTPLPPAILAASLGLHASALTRIGNDKHAVKVYGRALSPEMQPCLTPDSFRDICFGRAYALQRLMKYEEAVEQFRMYLNKTSKDQHDGGRDDIDQAVYGAATCALRVEDWDGAMVILKENVEGSNKSRNIALLALMQHIEEGADKASSYTLELLEQALQRDPKSPLIYWLHRIITGGDGSPDSNRINQGDFLDLAALNQCPLDDPRMIHLDDKICLHRLLSSSGGAGKFWPLGFILPYEKDKLMEKVEELDGQSPWILKDRAGYGSHGNRVASLDEVLDEKAKDEEDQILCQQIVHPTLLIDRRKFSLRVYCVCVGGSCEGDEMQFYISSEGLVKLASDPYDFHIAADGTSSSDSVFMTNSGLGEGDDAVQLTFHDLRREFEKQGWNYDKLWKGVVDSTRSTLLAYRSYCEEKGSHDPSMLRSQPKERNLCRLLHAKAKLPKILGLDFLVDNRQKPWLIEVNRFPGLEPRGSSDEAVKHKVVREAWDLACQKAADNVHTSGMLFNKDDAAVDIDAKEKGADGFTCSLGA